MDINYYFEEPSPADQEQIKHLHEISLPIQYEEDFYEAIVDPVRRRNLNLVCIALWWQEETDEVQVNLNLEPHEEVEVISCDFEETEESVSSPFLPQTEEQSEKNGNDQAKRKLIGVLIAQNIPHSSSYQYPCPSFDVDAIEPSLENRDYSTYILTLGVYPMYKRKGMASALMGELLRVAITPYSTSIFLHVLATNTPAIEFYEKFDFDRHSFLEDFYAFDEKSHDAYLYLYNRHTLTEEYKKERLKHSWPWGFGWGFGLTEFLASLFFTITNSFR